MLKVLHGPFLASDGANENISGHREWVWRVVQSLLDDEQPAVLRHALPGLLENLRDLVVSVVVKASSDVVDQSIYILRK